MTELEQRFAPLESAAAELGISIDAFRDAAIQRINDAVQPALDALTTTLQIGLIFSATSFDTKSSFTGVQTFKVQEADRQRYAPTAEVAMVADLTCWMSGRVSSYDRSTGILTVNVTTAFGTGTGPRTGWGLYPATPFLPAQSDPGTFASPSPGVAPYKALRSNTAGETPTAAQLPDGTLGFNFQDGRLVWKRPSDSTVRTTSNLEDIMTSADRSALQAADASEASSRQTADNNEASTRLSADNAQLDALTKRLRFDAAQVLTAGQAGQALDNLVFAIRADKAQTLSDAQRVQARLNLGVNAPVTPGGNISLAATDIERPIFFSGGGWTVTLPATASIFAGWGTGSVTNNDPGTLGTVQPPSGVVLYNEGIQVSSVVLAFKQRCRFVLMPDGSWQTQWTERRPLLLKINAPAGTASLDFRMPVGYDSFDCTIHDLVLSTAGQDWGFRLSADYGSTFRQSASDYVAIVGTNSVTATYAPVMQNMGNAGTGAAVGNCGAGTARGILSALYGTWLSAQYRINSAPTNTTEVTAVRQNSGAALINPNYMRFLAQAGTFTCKGYIQGNPAQ